MEYSDNDPGVDNSFVESGTESSTQLSDKEVELAEVSAADARSTELEGFNNEHLTRPLVSAAGLDSYGDVKPSQGADEMASLPLPQSQSALDPVIMEDLCPVCNDKVSGYHYGLQTCESCKGFFKRSVQNQKRYACVENQTCIIDKTQRKRCPYCRFQKCLSVGMKLEAVRPDRMRGGRNKFGPIYRRDRALRRQMRAQLQTDIDFQSVAQAAVSATLPRLDDSRPSYKYASVYGSNLDSVDEPVDVKPNLAELASYSSGYNRSTGVPRYSSVTAPATQPAVSSAQPATMSPANLHSQVPFGSFQPLNSAESKTSYSQDPLKGLTGMASAIVNQFIQQCDYSMTVSNSDSGHIQSVPIVQSAGQQAPSRQGSDASHNPYRLISTPGGSSYNQPPVYQNQIAEPARTFSECRRDLHYIDVSPGYPVAAMKGQKSTAAAERHLSPSRDDVSLYSSVESSLPMQRLNAPLTVAASVPEVTVSADTEGEASHRAAMTLQLISDLQRHSSNSRIPNGNSERLKRLAEELIQQTPTRTGPDGNATMDDAVRWAVALACRVCDQALFLLVEWARQAHFFRQLSIEDQMKLLESCWSELLLLDTLYKQLEHNDTQRVQMITGHYVTIDLLERIGLGSFCDQLQELIRRIRCLKLDANEYTCLRFIVLLNSDVPGLSDGARVEQFRAEVIAALLDYCSLLSLTNSGASSGGGSGSMEEEQASDKFGQMLLELSEIKMASQKIEQFVYQHYLNGTLNESDLLVEMLLSSRQ